MKKALITFLGTGGGKRTKGNAEFQYTKTRYQFYDANEPTEKSPFVGLEIQKKIKPNVVHIFGTKDSMWHTLFYHLLDTYHDYDKFADIDEKVMDLHQTDEIYTIKEQIENALSELLCAKVKIHFHDFLHEPFW